jgi:hypothetical protein
VSDKAISEVKRILISFNSIRYSMCAFMNEVLVFLDLHCPAAIVPTINFIMASPKIKE